jgi:ribonuclease HI
MIKDLVIRMV